MSSAFHPCLLLLLTWFAVPADARQAAVEAPHESEVRFEAADGVVLGGTLYSSGTPGPGILLSHMCDGGGRAAWDGLATSLARAGFIVLTWDYRGVGDSKGEPPRGGNLETAMEYWRTQQLADAESALELLLSQPGVDRERIGAGGASCGVYLSLLLARRHPEQVKALLLLAGPSDAETRAFVEGSASLSVLGVASEDDARSASWTRDITLASKNPASRLVMYASAGHGTQMLAKEKELEPLIVEWFGARYLPERKK